MQGINKKRLLMLAAAMLVLAAGLGLGLLGGQALEASVPKDILTPIRINEIMASNSTYPHEGRLCDWVELHNASSAPADLSGWGLSDDTQNEKYIFPQGTVLPAGGYLVVPCIRDGEDCAPFGISSRGGETLTLFNTDHTAIETVSTAPVLKGQSQARQTDGSWAVTEWATPGFENSPAGLEAWLAARGRDETTVRITEVMASNRITLPDGDGEFPDWIELTNTGRKDWDLTGYCLSDEEGDPFKWALPPVILGPEESLVVFCSGKTRLGQELHTSFSLSAGGGTVYLTSPLGLPADSFAYPALEADQSAAVTGDGSIAPVWTPTPGFENSETGREAFLTAADDHGALVIAEAAVMNNSKLQQPDGSFFDWLELQNVSGEDILLSDYSIRTNLNQPEGWTLPAVTLKSGERYLILCSGEEQRSNGWYTHAPFTLGAEEDRLYLFGPDGSLSDRCFLREVPYEGSMGRLEGKAGFFLFKTPTPGEANKDGFRYQAAMPRPLTAQGVYNGVDTLTVELQGEGTIYYTLNGTEPTELNREYTVPFVLEDTTVIRAVSVAEGKAVSEIATFSYILNENHDLPVVSLVAQEKEFFKGVYENVEERTAQCDAHVSFFDGAGGFDTDCSVGLHGLTSRVFRPKKSLKLEFQGRYGGHVEYDIFGSDITGFSSLILRTGVANYLSILRDEVAAEVAMEVSDTVLALDNRYCVLYINGEYWGVYALREDYSKRYVADHTGSAPDSVAVAKAPVTVSTPAQADLYQLLLDIESYGVTDPARYAAAAARFDMEALCDWMALEAYFNNNDVAGNIRYLKGDNTGGKWRIAFFDFDLGLANENADWVMVFDGTNQIGRITRQLIKNETFRALLLERMCLLMENGLNHETVQTTITELAGQVDPEIERDTDRWHGPQGLWQGDVETMLGFFTPERTETWIRELDRYLFLTGEEFAMLRQYI